MLMYDNEFKTKGNKIEPQHIQTKMRFPSHPREKVRCQGLPGAARTHPNISFEQIWT